MPSPTRLQSVVRIAATALSASLIAGPAAAVTTILSTRNPATLGGLTFANGVVVDFQLIANDHDLLNTAANETLGGLFLDGDLVDSDPTSDIETLFLAETTFDASEDIDAVYAPELETGILVAAGLFWLALAHRRTRLHP